MDRAELHKNYALSPEQLAFYRDNGYVHIRNLLSPEVLARYRGEIARLVHARAQVTPIEQRSTYDKAFLQVTNLWRASDVVRELVFGQHAARVAAELMGCRGVRLYHDQALFKEPGGGFTPWHADQYYWPVASDNTVTAWIPLVNVSLDMGPLTFCPKSHRLQAGRELPIGDESEASLKQMLANLGSDEQPFALGDVSFHSGWTFHRAGSNQSSSMREVFTVIYMDVDMRLAQPRNRNQEVDREAFAPGISVGEVMASALNPVLYPQ